MQVIDTVGDANDLLVSVSTAAVATIENFSTVVSDYVDLGVTLVVFLLDVVANTSDVVATTCCRSDNSSIMFLPKYR